MLPSSNWLVLKKKLTASGKREDGRPTKRRRKSESASSVTESQNIEVTTQSNYHDFAADQDSVDFLRRMVLGQIASRPAHSLPGKYVSIDCEMVGIAGNPKHPSMPGKRRIKDESSLGRVSIVNYHGVVLLDAFVQQRERVTDWRTPYSGIRESDMVNAKPFMEVQKMVSDLLKDRILVGHAVHNDLKVLLLSHPHNMIRDTQVLAGKHGTLSASESKITEPSSQAANVKVRRNKKPALRKLVSRELGIEIQTGEHSSVIDARATMAIYRLHRKNWDKGFKAVVTPKQKRLKSPSGAVMADQSPTLDVDNQGKYTSRKRPLDDMEDDAADDTSDATRQETTAGRRPKKKPSGKSAGQSTGISLVVKKREGKAETKLVVRGTKGKGIRKDTKWWETLN